MNEEAAGVETDCLAAKTRRVFGNLVIDKRRLPMSKLQSRGIPSYVAEWVLESIVPGEGPLNMGEIDKVQAWSHKVIPGADEQNVIKFKLQRGDTVKILTPVQVDIILQRKRSDRIAKMGLLGINDAHITDELVEKYPALLEYGMWGVTELVHTPDGVAIVSFKPMQASFNLDVFKSARREFTLDEWKALLLVSMGYDPAAFSEAEQSMILCRLLPLVQKNMHLIELAPKGTGKSYVYENISPHVRLVSGGNVSPAVLFVNNQTSQPGILARYSVVVLDEVQTLKFERPEEIVGGLKGYLANGRLTRGGLHEMASDCGLVLLANIALDEDQHPVSEPIVRELPPFLRETAFLDRIKGLIPGWEIRKLTASSFAASVGLKSDFFGDALIGLRDDLTADQLCAKRIELCGERVFKRNIDSVRAIASGMVKILFPHCELTDHELQKFCVKPAVKLRQLIWDQLYNLDTEYRQFDRVLVPRLIH